MDYPYMINNKKLHSYLTEIVWDYFISRKDHGVINIVLYFIIQLTYTQLIVLSHGNTWTEPVIKLLFSV